MIPILRGMTKGQPQRGKRNTFIMPVAMLAMLFLIGQAIWLSDNRQMFAPFSVKRISCEVCNKVGVIRDEHDTRIMKMCPACFGVGYHSIRMFDEMDVVCAACGGMGRLKSDGGWRTCQRCDGRGVHRADEWENVTEVVPQQVLPESP